MVESAINPFAVGRRVAIVSVAQPMVGEWDKRRSHPTRGDYWARCPFHDDKTPSFHVDAGKNVFKCFGCGVGGDVIDFVARAERISRSEAATRLADGLTGDGHRWSIRSDRRSLAQQLRRERLAKTKQALTLWDASDVPCISNGVVRPYLGSACRLLNASTVALSTRPGAAIREHCDAKGRRSMVVAAHDPRGRLSAVQQTWVRAGGRGKAQDRRITTGALSKAAVRLIAPHGAHLAIAEGVETALSFYDLFRIPCWAALGTSNLQAFVPPPEVKHVFIAVDGDRSGYEAAAKLFSRLKGRVRCTLSAAPDGLDWSDVLIARRGGPDR